jgi:hypothetical protein
MSPETAIQQPNLDYIPTPSQISPQEDELHIVPHHFPHLYRPSQAQESSHSPLRTQLSHDKEFAQQLE